MKHSVYTLLFFSMLFFQSCNKDNTSDLEKVGEEIELREGNLMDSKECFELVYPIEIVMPDESIISVEDEDQFYTKVKAWYRLNPDSKERPGLNYPIQVTFNGDKSKRITNEEQMMRLKKFCSDKSSYKREVCFKLLFPVTYTLPDGTSISGENEIDIRSQLKEWHTANPDSDVKPLLSYPIKIKVIGGDIIIIKNEEEMIAIKKRCSQQEKIDCFEMDFPISFNMPNGTILSVDNEEAMNTSIKNWYQSNPDETDKPSLIYPINVILENGKVWTINNEEEMIKLKKRCDYK